MHFTVALELRRILNSSYHPFRIIPKPSVWPKRERLKRFTAWQYGQGNLTVKTGYRKLNKIFIYMDMQRKDAAHMERYFAEERLKAALEEHNADYSIFKIMLNRCHILLDKRMLTQLALYEPRTFKSFVDLTEKMALINGEEIFTKPEDLDHVDIDSSLFGQPFPYTRIFPGAAKENHINVPRKLKVDEY